MEGSVSNVEICNLAYTGELEELKKCVLSDSSLVTKTDQDSRTALHWACSAGHVDIVQFLLNLGVEVNLQDDIAQILLENGADPNATDKLQSTPLHRASAKGNFRLIQLLLKESASTNIQDSEGNTPLHLACDEERADAAKLLVEHGASIYIENKEKMTPLQVAKGGLGSMLRRIVEG
ncbi:26S proteasome non-ATPase regulatory subunit 10 [Anabarilius grahami]|uniref:26S proteasome non-ATPase regulatory subunit 10 n=1 Tax=Anabarilius grahami TaxID=495550 RepID=A0A3N0YN40_ANAGA|nr:26S proteasome non-ATPase regulatory subunit 10 [Anabarilius grahami]